jgi:dynein intermediate chain 1
MSFDLGNSVGDVCWSPYSSTVFAAVTSDGKVYVFDLAQNKHEPLCEQRVVKRAKLTRIRFNERFPIIIVGDDGGGINSLKLSPNLRKLLVDSAGTDTEVKGSSPAAVQRNRLENLLQSIDIATAAL